jgi:hypothetical protein
MTEFDQKTFNEDHKEPRDYGEGDYYIISDTYTPEEAARIIGKWESDLTGETHTYKASDISGMNMYVSNKNDDGIDDWCVNNWTNEPPVAVGIGISR